ncbi:hypothetical protein TNCV_1045651 [Trichonephila clavipes]|nr:hypothetical protein TNCV_1045651 [Trichonephila clavipes]
MTIHKSQGGTYDAIVYEYDRKHPRELVYVALSRVTKIEGLFMVTKEKILKTAGNFGLAAPAAFNPLSGTVMFMVLETWVRRGRRDFGSGGPMGVQETSPMEEIFD